LPGDEKYGDFALNKRLPAAGLRRMGLHAWRMAFRHPLSGAPLEFVAPVPAGISSYIAAVNGSGALEFAIEGLERFLADPLSSA
jgi:23S rRNA pseudouridine955/2504/2580 synthase